MADEVRVNNIGNNATGWVSRLVGTFFIVSAIGAAGTRISNAIDAQTNAIDRQTHAIQEQTQALRMR